jgi:hypothetical protein
MSGKLDSVNDGGVAKIAVAAFLGKIVAAIFLAICTALGFGPTEWSQMIIGIEITTLGRVLFLVLALITALSLSLPWWHARPWRAISPTEASRLIYRKASPQLRELIQRGTHDLIGSPIEAWGRERLQVFGAAGEIALRGKRGPGLPYETIPSHLIEELRVGDDDGLSDPHGGPQFVEVIVSRSDAMHVLAECEREVFIPSNA